ncbi:MAG: hypothetical protein ACKO7A_08420, partial [Microcystis sp.]
ASHLDSQLQSMCMVRSPKIGVADLGYDQGRRQATKNNPDQAQKLGNVLNVNPIISIKMVIKKENRTIFV